MNRSLFITATAAVLFSASALSFAQATPSDAPPAAQAPAGPPPGDGGGPPPGPHGRHDVGRGLDRHPGPDDPMMELLPPGPWWRNSEVAARIGLTSQQTDHIDGIFLEARSQLIHMHASLEEEQLRLEPLLRANPIDQPKALAQISRIADTRADLEKANAKMLLDIRSVLSADQWTKLQQAPMGPGSRHERGSRSGAGPEAPAGPPSGPGLD